MYEYSVRERGGWKGTVVWGSDNVPCPMNTDCRNDADSSCYICAAMYAMCLNKIMLVIKKIPVGTRFSARPDRPWGPPSLLYNGYWVFPGGRGGRGVLLTTHPLLVPRSWKSTAIPLLPLWACVAYKKGENLPTFVTAEILTNFTA